jgi:hypothetical protein
MRCLAAFYNPLAYCFVDPISTFERYSQLRCASASCLFTRAEADFDLGIDLLPEQVRRDFVLEERHHACAIMHTDFRAEWDDLIAALEQLRLPRSQILAPGGRKSPISVGINGFFYQRGWAERKFNIEVLVDGERTLSPTHHVDYFRNRIAIETEWNNKDPFYDRDLTTFRLLFDLNVLSAGIIITRADDLQGIFDALGKGNSYGQSTTHMSRLTPRMHNRASGGCPVLAVGMTARLYNENA